VLTEREVGAQAGGHGRGPPGVRDAGCDRIDLAARQEQVERLAEVMDRAARAEAFTLEVLCRCGELVLVEQLHAQDVVGPWGRRVSRSRRGDGGSVRRRDPVAQHIPPVGTDKASSLGEVGSVEQGLDLGGIHGRLRHSGR